MDFLRFLVGLAIMLGIAAVMYSLDPPIPKPLYTAKDCTHAINQVFFKGRNYEPTSAERHDLDICTDPP
jgi:hypothetical protein